MAKPRIETKSKFEMPDMNQFISVFKDEVKIVARKISSEVASSMAKEAKEILDTQRYNWKKLNPQYLKYKFRNYLDPRTLIATGYYRDHISWWRDSKGFVHVGVRPRAIHKPSGLPLAILARIHEFGTARIPPRPLWRPLLAKYIREVPRFRNVYKRAVDKAAAKTRTKTITVKSK